MAGTGGLHLCLAEVPLICARFSSELISPQERFETL
jgi:hypothetical protein